ncbi:Cholinesterase [Drechslerella dactyloides]|uniref:Cholinesterase n=1 Tax=Drechslerella dactyloides TaxID=74499 RepID=A0AAD6NJ51_DREDA|nr:Cholinesterase [Drechslerella dactyloides]
MQYKEMIDKLPPLIHVGPSIEARFLDDVVDLSILPRKTCPGWCSEIVIGDCFHDATCFKTRILSRPNNAEYFIECINYALAREQAESVIHAYKLSPSDPPEKSLVHCIELLTDLRWYLPILHTDFGRKSMSPKVSRYHFHQLNRFDCQWHGLAAHLFDITLLLQNHRHVLSKDEIKLGEDMADRVLGLAYGDGFISQHENNGDEDKVVVWGPHGNTKLLTREEYDATMRQGRGKLLLKLGAEVCEKLADTIQFGIAQ